MDAESGIGTKAGGRVAPGSRRSLAAVAAALALAGRTGAPPAPQDLVDIGIRETGVGGVQPLRASNPDGSSGGDFATPADRHLVMTSLKIFPVEPGPGWLRVRLLQAPSDAAGRAARDYWIARNDGPTEFTYPSGFPIAPGQALWLENMAGSAGPLYATINGHLAP